jgi:hypothetical protein
MEEFDDCTTRSDTNEVGQDNTRDAVSSEKGVENPICNTQSVDSSDIHTSECDKKSVYITSSKSKHNGVTVTFTTKKLKYSLHKNHNLNVLDLRFTEEYGDSGIWRCSLCGDIGSGIVSGCLECKVIYCSKCILKSVVGTSNI